MAQKINDREFRLVLPKHDNAGNKINPDRLAKVAERVSDRFGGVTVHPEVLGCFQEELEEGEGEELVCEENAMLITVRDSSDGVPFEQDEEWIEGVANDLSEDLGQWSVMTSEDVVEVAFEGGEEDTFQTELDGDKVLGKTVFHKLL